MINVIAVCLSLSLSLVAFSFSGFTHQFNWKASAGLSLPHFVICLLAICHFFFPYLLRRRLLLGFLINFPFFCSMIFFVCFCRVRRCGLTFTLLRLSIVLDGASTVHRASWSLLKCIHIIKSTFMLISLMMCKVKEKRRSSRVHSFICCPHHLITFCTWNLFVLFIDCPFFLGGAAKVDKGQQLINRDCVSKNQKSWNILSSSSNAVTILPWVG